MILNVLFGMLNIILYIKQSLTVRLSLIDRKNAEIIQFNKTANALLKYEGQSKIIESWLIYFDWVGTLTETQYIYIE